MVFLVEPSVPVAGTYVIVGQKLEIIKRGQSQNIVRTTTRIHYMQCCKCVPLTVAKMKKILN